MRWEKLHDGTENSRGAVQEKKKPSVKMSRKWNIMFGGSGLPSSPPQDDSSRFRVDTGQECRARRANKATATSLVSGKH